MIQNQLNEGMIEMVTEDKEEGERRNHIPHHAVIKPDNITTKIGLAYDASAKSKKSNSSLNECLHRGPVILEDNCGLFLLGATIKHHLEKEMSRILKDIYVNNLITGMESEEEAYQLYTMSKQKFN